MERTFTLEEINKVAAECLSEAGERKVVAFHGNLGAGKTTLIRALCSLKRVRNAVSSPTFSIINEYENDREKMYHIDLYRLQDEREAVQAGVEDCLYSGYLCLVEWPERAAGLFPDETVHVYLEVVDQFTRRIVISDN